MTRPSAPAHHRDETHDEATAAGPSRASSPCATCSGMGSLERPELPGGMGDEPIVLCYACGGAGTQGDPLPPSSIRPRRHR